MYSELISVSSTTSCNKLQIMDVGPKPMSWATIFATDIGCVIIIYQTFFELLWALIARLKAERIIFFI